MIPSADVTVVVVTYNRKALLTLCLNALRRQTLAPARIIVIDNASTDSRAGRLRSSRPG